MTESEYEALIERLDLRRSILGLKRLGTERKDLLARIRRDLVKAGVEGRRDLADVLLHRIENPPARERP